MVFPTIKVFNNGESEEYNGRRDKESIIDFLKNINQNGGSIDYYQKYIKYKNKYIELKKSLE